MANVKVIPGRIYVVAGQGEMKAVKEHPNSIEMLQHGNMTYWASKDQIVREATAKDLQLRYAEAKARGVSCEDPACWCRPFELRFLKLDGRDTIVWEGTQTVYAYLSRNGGWFVNVPGLSSRPAKSDEIKFFDSIRDGAA